MITETTTHSKISFNCIEKTSVVTEQLSIKPLKIVNPKSIKNTAICMLTNYGGGYIEGDTVALEVYCAPNTTSIISSQANTRVYESDGIVCKQEINIEMASNAFHVFLNDPLVMHRGGSLIQSNNITMQKGAVLLFVDWFSAGRTANGEVFSFECFNTSTKIEMDTKIVVWDNFKISPKEIDYQSPGAFGEHVSFLNIFLVGDSEDEKITLLETSLNQLEIIQKNEIAYNISRTNTYTIIGRFSATNITILKEVVTTISTILSHKGLLGFDLIDRKY